MKADLCIVLVLQICTVLFTFTTGSPQNAKLPPTDFPTNNSTFKIINIETVPPIEFPSNTSKYNIIHNTTILKTLSNSSNSSLNIDTEVVDLNVHVPHPEDVSQRTDNGENKQIPESTKYSTSKSNNQGPDGDAEIIENDLSKTEDIKLNSTRLQSEIHGEHEHKSRNGIPMLQGELAAVLAGVFAFIAIIGYIGLLTWRRYLEHRYGNREMLIDEEEYTNYSDMKNFEL